MDVVVHVLCPMVAALNGDKPRMDIARISSNTHERKWVCIHGTVEIINNPSAFCVLPGGSVWLVQTRYEKYVGYFTWLKTTQGQPARFLEVSSFVAHSFPYGRPTFVYDRATQSATLEITGCWRMTPQFSCEPRHRCADRHSDVLPSPCIGQQIRVKNIPQTEDSSSMPKDDEMLEIVNGEPSLRIPTRCKPPFKLVAHLDEILRRRNLSPCKHHPRKRPGPVSFCSPTKFVNPHKEQPPRIKLPLPSNLLLHQWLSWASDEEGRFHILATCCQEDSHLIDLILVYSAAGVPLGCVQFPYEACINGDRIRLRVDAAGNYLALTSSGESLWVIDSSRGNFHLIKNHHKWHINAIEIIHDGSVAVMLYDGTIWRLEGSGTQQQQ